MTGFIAGTTVLAGATAVMTVFSKKLGRARKPVTAALKSKPWITVIARK